ncbi:MAG: polymorphic toxin type 47 domain-containing protein [Spirochaetota bacterium]
MHTKPKIKPLQERKGVAIPKRKHQSKQGLKLFVSIVLLLSLAYITNQNETKSAEQEQIELKNIEEKIASKQPLANWEKKRFCQLLAKIRGIQLFACKENYFCNLGSLTGYELKPGDIDLRGSEITFTEALKIAFTKTGIDTSLFEAREWAKDINGKSGVVSWDGPGGSEVTIDAPHKYDGPDVFHIGYKTGGKKQNRRKGHILLDCVPYFREIK